MISPKFAKSFPKFYNKKKYILIFELFELFYHKENIIISNLLLNKIFNKRHAAHFIFFKIFLTATFMMKRFLTNTLNNKFDYWSSWFVKRHRINKQANKNNWVSYLRKK
jgi:hypothetical protein